jgi:cytochrome c biogenesis protein ResB
MKNFFLSLKTTVWTLLAFIVVFFAGSYLMPAHREVFGPMNEMLLFPWMADVALRRPWQTWWFFLSLALLGLLTVNTIVCSVQAIKGRWSREDFLLRIAPQIVHIGFLLILLAHLLGAGWGYRLSGLLPEGASAAIPGDRVLHLRQLRIVPDPAGYVSGWEAQIEISRNNERIASGVLAPNSPLFHEGTGIYLKSFELERIPAAFLLVNRDPGALWALAGGVLFIIGSVIVVVLKWKRTQDPVPFRVP